MASVGVAPRVMGIGPAPAAREALSLAGSSLDQLDVIELNEVFASQAIAVLRNLGLEAADPRINPNGGAIALGHPLGMSGARIALSATEELCRSGGKRALVFMCIGVGQWLALLFERV
jgi:acetyl-CoA acyltransferase